MNNGLPMKISVITAVFNGASSIKDALDSVFTQTYTNVESVVVDGASTDGTVEILDRYTDRIAILVSEPDEGIYDALNKGIHLASGDVIGFLHADDKFADREVLAWIAEAFSDPDVDATYGDLVYVRNSDPDRVLRYWRAGEFAPARLRQGWMPPHPTFYVRRSVYERLGGFDATYRIAADYDCMLRFLGAGGVRCAYLPKVLVSMRVGGMSNHSITNILRKSREDYRALCGNGIGGIGSLLWKNLSKVPQFLQRQRLS